jgi:hypothetical protein
MVDYWDIDPIRNINKKMFFIHLLRKMYGNYENVKDTSHYFSIPTVDNSVEE